MRAVRTWEAEEVDGAVGSFYQIENFFHRGLMMSYGQNLFFFLIRTTYFIKID